MWTMKIPVLSMDHIKPESLVWLQNTEEILCAYKDDVMFVFVPEETPSAPIDLSTVLDWARATEFAWIRLDEAGDTIPDLPLYNWR